MDFTNGQNPSVFSMKRLSVKLKKNCKSTITDERENSSVKLSINFMPNDY